MPAVPYAIIEERRQTRFLNLYSAIERDRLRWDIVSYDPATGRHQERLTAFVPITRTRQLMHTILAGTATRPGWRFEALGGSEAPDGTLESRLVTVEYDPAGDRFFDNPFRISIEVGPGTRTTTGGIGPAAKGQSLFMRFEVEAVTGICLEIAAFLVAHQHEIEEHRYREQVERYHGRRGRTDTSP